MPGLSPPPQIFGVIEFTGNSRQNLDVNRRERRGVWRGRTFPTQAKIVLAWATGESSHRRLGKTVGRHRCGQCYARPSSSPRACAQVRSAQLENQNRIVFDGTTKSERNEANRWRTLMRALGLSSYWRKQPWWLLSVSNRVWALLRIYAGALCFRLWQV
jgi:hypothetical protein